MHAAGHHSSGGRATGEKGPLIELRTSGPVSIQVMYKLEMSDQKQAAGLLVPCKITCVWCVSCGVCVSMYTTPLPPLGCHVRMFVCMYIRSYITCLIQQLKLFLVDSCKNVVYDGKHHLKRARRDG